MVKILDCTLRDGGYHTNWYFNKILVDSYIIACNDLPVDYLEVGYRSISLEGYYGEYLSPCLCHAMIKGTNKQEACHHTQ